MKTHHHLFFLALALVFFGSCGGPTEAVSDTAGEEAPNIVFIISDDQAWTDYGFMGHRQLNTPNLDKLANEGLTFVQSYVPTSLCAPSLASIATGVYPRRHQVLGNDRMLPDDKPEDKEERKKIRSERYRPVIDHFRQLNTLPDMLKEKGYLSFQTGKWWLGNYANGGFDMGMTHGDPQRGGRHGDYGLEIGRKGMDTLYNYIDYALEEEKPFFLWYAPYLPHRPHNPPDSLYQKYLPLAPSEYVARYWAMCEWFDHTCGELIDYIDGKGLTGNTLFVYVCDNGWVQEENAEGYTKKSKRSPYDYGLKTPIIYKWSGKIAPQYNTRSLASSLDIVPTVLGMLNMERPEGLDGIDVLDESALTKRETLYGEIYAHDFSTIDNSLFYRMAITDPYKIIVPDEKNKPGEVVRLYNLSEDPFEETNLADQYPQIVDQLSTRIEVSWKQ
ncbi:sulfatase-like hydrolase/transferase [Neolewinella aurantiaca]|uniref:Sulfatase-like hydrolase/transferase n=1 Tax=Neolewinella aurantiaca TaxID=2602767 RepID=A0A5C7FGV6_9BACT|nr:sulfatase-like hydrolase/transferase [Neolewinella aurantiaca]TXF90245.1 sulfatase-like hydrolase/transferase [Neolewinella aurantiaca]